MFVLRCCLWRRWWGVMVFQRKASLRKTAWCGPHLQPCSWSLSSQHLLHRENGMLEEALWPGLHSSSVRVLQSPLPGVSVECWSSHYYYLNLEYYHSKHICSYHYYLFWIVTAEWPMTRELKEAWTNGYTLWSDHFYRYTFFFFLQQSGPIFTST